VVLPVLFNVDRFDTDRHGVVGAHLEQREQVIACAGFGDLRGEHHALGGVAALGDETDDTVGVVLLEEPWRGSVDRQGAGFDADGLAAHHYSVDSVWDGDAGDGAGGFVACSCVNGDGLGGHADRGHASGSCVSAAFSTSRMYFTTSSST